MKQAISITLAVTLLMTSPVIAQTISAQPPNNLTAAQYALEKCIAEATDKYLTSSEAATVIAEGALGQCESLRMSWVDAFEHQGITYSFAAKTTLEEGYFAALKRQSISRVLNYRARK